MGGVSFVLVFILTGDGYIGVEEKIKIGLYGDNGEVVLGKEKVQMGTYSVISGNLIFFF